VRELDAISPTSVFRQFEIYTGGLLAFKEITPFRAGHLSPHIFAEHLFDRSFSGFSRRDGRLALAGHLIS